MSEQIRVAVSGACGRMGQEVVASVQRQSDMTLVAVFDIAQHEGTELAGLQVTSSMAQVMAAAPQVLVDFTRFDSAPAHLRTALMGGVACVVGTTGIAPSTLDELAGLAQDCGLFVAPNFSVGAVLMMVFARQAAKYFEWAEIIELHHDKKLDAPSGTAIRTADMMLEQRDAFSAPASETLKIDGVRGGLKSGVRIHSVRLPGFLAHQEVLFGGEGEVLTLRHDSTHRSSFMPGVMLSIRQVLTVRGLVVGLEKLMEAR